MGHAYCAHHFTPRDLRSVYNARNKHVAYDARMNECVSKDDAGIKSAPSMSNPKVESGVSGKPRPPLKAPGRTELGPGLLGDFYGRRRSTGQDLKISCEMPSLVTGAEKGRLVTCPTL